LTLSNDYGLRGQDDVTIEVKAKPATPSSGSGGGGCFISLELEE
jgi:hypothetical protein